MKRTALVIAFFAHLCPVFSQNLAGLDRWILGFPRNKTDLAGYRITRCVIERTGTLVAVDRAGLPVRFNLLKPVERGALVARFRAIEKTILDRDELAADKWRIVPRECEIDFGLKDEMIVTLKLSSLRLQLNAETVIELAGRLSAGPVFTQAAGEAGFRWTLLLRSVNPDAGRGEAFPGWTAYMKGTIRWFQAGINDNDQEVLAIVLDTKVMGDDKKQGPKAIDLSRSAGSHLAAGLSFDYLMSNIVSGEDAHIFFRPAAYHLVQAMFCLSWRNLGDPAWLVKPYRLTVGLGGFFEFHAGYFWRQDDFIGYPESNGSFMFAFGPSLRIEFAAMVPRIIDDTYAGDLIGLGIELLSLVNVAYFLPEYFYEYFLNQYVNFVIYLLPDQGLDLILGINAAFTTVNYDENSGAVGLNKYAFSAGVRLRKDF